MITFQQETVSEYVRDCAELLAEIQSEHGHGLEVKPDFATYEAAERAGVLHILTARDNGSLVGCIIFVVRNHPHHVDLLCGYEDAFHLATSHRLGMTGVRMIREGNRMMSNLGVKRVFYTTDLKNDSGPLLERIGFEKTNVVYSIRV